MPLGPPDMTSVVQSYSTPGTRRRFAANTTNGEGFRVKGAATDLPTLGHIFPASGELIARFELQDVAGLYEVHTTTELVTANPLTETAADQWIVLVRAVVLTYDVLRAGPWLEGPAGANNWTVAALQQVVPT